MVSQGNFIWHFWSLARMNVFLLAIYISHSVQSGLSHIFLSLQPCFSVSGHSALLKGYCIKETANLSPSCGLSLSLWFFVMNKVTWLQWSCIYEPFLYSRHILWLKFFSTLRSCRHPPLLTSKDFFSFCFSHPGFKPGIGLCMIR